MSTTLVARTKAGDPFAFAALFARCHQEVLDLAGWGFNARQDRRGDAEEVASSVLISLHRHLTGDGPLGVGVQSTDSLIRVLRVLTRQKVKRRKRFLGQQKRDASRETAVPDDLSDRSADPALRDDSLAVGEVLDRLDPDTRAVAELLAAGHLRAEIADRLNCGERTVYRRQGLIADALRAAGLGG